MERIIIRKGRKGDMKRVAELYAKEVLSGKYAAHAEELMGTMDAAKRGYGHLKKYVVPSGEWFLTSSKQYPRFMSVAEVDGEIVGFIDGMISYRYIRPAAYLSDVVIDRRWRGKGVYSLLNKEFEKFANKHKARYLWLDVNPSNKKMTGIIENKGYKFLGKIYLKKL